MKKIFFSFLLFLLWGVGGLFAQATVTPLGADYDRQEVKFRVAWNAATAANNRVWVWVDFCSVTGTTPGTFAPATITSASVTSGAPADLNGRGFFVTVNGATVTAKLSTAGQFNWCAYGSDFPPNAVENGSSYTLKGSKPFIITTSSGTVEVNATTYSGNEIIALSDATGCPGVLCSKNGEATGVLGCCNGTSNCNGTCKTNSTYTQNDGACSPSCLQAYVQLYDQCGSVINPTYGLYEQTACYDQCHVKSQIGCRGTCLKNNGYIHWAYQPTYQQGSCACSDRQCPCEPINPVPVDVYVWRSNQWTFLHRITSYCKTYQPHCY
ncbi:MAG: hypothetical protein LBU42_02595 [Prevotellaceae bacterium]|jgi:hypothetical protein|nr:hypothetical protein [Prevotellaceae bacterium]